MRPVTRRHWLAGALATSLHGETLSGALDFAKLIPERIRRTAVFRDGGFHVWDPAMIRTQDGACNLLYSRWPVSLGFDAWATHAEIAWATSDTPDGPYRPRKTVLASRGADFWDGHSVYNTCLLAHGGKFYLYYTGNRGPATWSKQRSPSTSEEAWWVQRNNQRIGVAVAAHPGGPWKRFDHPLVDTGAETGGGIIAVPNVIAKPGGGFLMIYKTLAPGPGRFGGGVVHYPAIANHPLGPFRRRGEPIIDKQKILHTSTPFHFHLDDHVEWFQDGSYYGIVKDHDAPFLTPHGRALLLIESSDGIHWRLARHVLVKDFSVRWDDGETQRMERLEMPKLHLEQGRPRTLFLAARAEADPAAPSFLLTVPLRGGAR